MGGKSKSQTTGYKYFMGLHMGLCHGPVDALLEIKCGDRTAWSGTASTSESIAVNAPKLFGGDEKEGGVVGMVDVMMGEPTQLRNEYLETQTGADRPAYRGLLGLVFRGAKASERSLFGSVISSILSGMALGGGGHITSNNPYIKPWAVRVRRILHGWKGGTAWYAAKAPIVLVEGSESGPTGNVWLSYEGSTGDTYVGNHDGSAWALVATGLAGGTFANTMIVRAGSKLYVRNDAKVHYADVSDLTSWAYESISNDIIKAKNLVADSTYLYVQETMYGSQRMTLPSSAITNPTVSGVSRTDMITIKNGVLYGFQNGWPDLNISTDNGLNWTDGGAHGADTWGAQITNNGSDLLIVGDSGSTTIQSKLSSDNGATWSSAATLFTGVLVSPIGMAFYEGKYFAVAVDGQCAYSTTGLSWTTGATVPENVVNVTYGIGKIVVGCDNLEMYQTTDHGASWTAFTSPVAPSAGNNIYAYCIGEAPGGAYVPGLKAMNPAHIVYECLTNAEWGMGYDSSIIDDASFTAAADVFFAEGLGLCIQWLRQDSIENFIKLVMDHAGAVTVEDRTTGLIQLKPLRGDYDIGTLPEFGSELGNVIEMRRFERGAVTDAINEVSVSYTDATTGKTGSVAVQNLAAVQASGRVISQSVDYPGLPTMDLALRTAMRDLQAYTSGLARVHLTVNRSGYSLTPGDVIKFSWLPDGIESMVLRVIDIDYGSLTDGKVMLECLEDVFGLPATTYVAQQTSGWEEPSGAAEASPAVAVFEAPYRELIGVLGRSETQALSDDAGYLMAVAARAPGFNLNYQLYTRISPADYADSGAGDWCPSGTIDAAIGPSDTLITLAGAEDIELVEVGGTAMLGSDETAEIVRVDAVDADTLELTIARGCLDTVPKPWPLGTRFWSIDTYSAGSTTEYATAETVNAKMLTRTGSDLLAESAAPGATLTLDQRQVRPYPPGLLRFLDDLNTSTGLAYPVELAGAITATWAHRDRLLQDDQVIDEGDASIGPEASTTYTVTYYQPPGTLVNTESALSGTAATAYTFPADGPAEIRVEASRGGFVSWQSAQHIFDYYRFPRITTVAGAPRITDDGSARKVI